MREEIASDRYIGGLLDHSGGHIHPLNLALGEAEAIRLQGGRIFEQSAVVKINHGTPATVITEKGQVQAKYVIVAGNAYLGNKVEPELARRSMPCGTQIVTTEPLQPEVAASLLPKNYCVEDCNYLLDYYRLTGDNRLLYGGGVVYGARDPDDIDNLIVPKLLKTFPQLKGVKSTIAGQGISCSPYHACRNLADLRTIFTTCKAIVDTASPVHIWLGN